jgi:hypothetical protein
LRDAARTLTKPALKRLVDDQNIDVKNVWGDRGLASKLNSAMLERREIRNGICARSVSELSDKLANEPGFREGLKRRAVTETRIGIFRNVLCVRSLLAKGFENRELAVGWAALTHNLRLVARMAEAEKKRREAYREKASSAGSVSCLKQIVGRNLRKSPRHGGFGETASRLCE